HRIKKNPTSLSSFLRASSSLPTSRALCIHYPLQVQCKPPHSLRVRSATSVSSPEQQQPCPRCRQEQPCRCQSPVRRPWGKSWQIWRYAPATASQCVAADPEVEAIDGMVPRNSEMRCGRVDTSAGGPHRQCTRNHQGQMGSIVVDGDVHFSLHGTC
ncbi:unnamed protein product, partial [Urochloa humidicola]